MSASSPNFESCLNQYYDTTPIIQTENNQYHPRRRHRWLRMLLRLSSPSTYVLDRRTIGLRQLPHHGTLLRNVVAQFTQPQCDLQRLSRAASEFRETLDIQRYGRNEARGRIRHLQRATGHHGSGCQCAGHHGQLHPLPQAVEHRIGQGRTDRLYDGKDRRRQSLLGLPSQCASRRIEQSVKYAGSDCTLSRFAYTQMATENDE